MEASMATGRLVRKIATSPVKGVGTEKSSSLESVLKLELIGVVWEQKQSCFV